MLIFQFFLQWSNCFASSSDPLGGVKNLQVIDPTINTLTVRWDPAVGNVRSYKVFYTAEPGGEERMVGPVLFRYGIFIFSHWLEGFAQDLTCQQPRNISLQLHLCYLTSSGLSALLDYVVVMLTEVLTFHWTGGGVSRHHQHHPEELGSQHRLQRGCCSHLSRRGGHTRSREGKDKWVTQRCLAEWVQQKTQLTFLGVCVCIVTGRGK